MSLKTPVFRASYVNLYKPRAMRGDGGEELGTPKFSVVAIFDPASFTEKEKEVWKELIAAMDEAVKEFFDFGLRDAPANFRKGLRKVEERRDRNGAIPKGFDIPGGLFANLTANAEYRPGVVDRNGANIGPEWDNAHRAYSGVYARASVRPYCYKKAGNQGIALGLQNVQVVGDGEPLGAAKIAAADDFSDLPLDTDTSRFIAPAASGNGSAPVSDAESPF